MNTTTSTTRRSHRRASRSGGGRLAAPLSALPELDRLFSDPPAEYGPTPLWWWSGEEVTSERMTWQLRRLAEGGIHNLVVINLAPAGPIFGARPDEPAWFSEVWWNRFAEACGTAEELGSKIWFYDQVGFSGANIQGQITLDEPEVAGLRLRHRRDQVARGRVRLDASEVLVAAFDHKLRTPCSRDGYVDAPDDRTLDLLVSAPTAFDYLNPHATELLLDRVHREFERRVPQYLGSVIPGSFQDELPNTNSWSNDFAEEFARRKGYDLLDHGLCLFRQDGDPAGDLSAKVRGDYYKVRAELTEAAFFRPLGTWHSDRGLLIGADQSNPARAGFPTQSTQIYTDYFRTHRWYGAVGSDHEGDAKVHSSMAHLYGHPRTWVESFHSSGWGGTLEETYDWLLPFLRSGGNLYNPHASYFSTVGGWFEWAPPSTDWRQPYWSQYRLFADAVARICSIMSWGTYEADVAVLHPTADAQADVAVDEPVAYFGSPRLGAAGPDADRAQRTYLELAGSNNWFHERRSALDDAGVAFDVIDDSSVQAATTSEGYVGIRAQRYSTVLLPSMTTIEEGTARQLVRLLEAGGTVVSIGTPPRRAAGRDGDDSIVAELATHPRLTVHGSAGDAVAQIDPGDHHVSSGIPLLVRRKGEVGAALVTGAYPGASSAGEPASEHRHGGHDVDRWRYARSTTVMIDAEVAEAEAWNPATGERVPVTVEDGPEGRSSVIVPQDGAPAWILVWREGRDGGDDAIPAPHDEVEQDTRSLTGWTGELVSTLDNTWGDLARPVGRDLSDPELWHVETLQADGTWMGTRATFGQNVLVKTGSGTPEPPLDPDRCREAAAGRASLADETWQRFDFSASRGADRDRIGQLGTKGNVPSEFILSDRPPGTGHVTVRALVSTDHVGPGELIVLAGAAKQVWWNGAELRATDGYVFRAPVILDRPVNVLEYRVTELDRQQVCQPLGSGFGLALPAGFTDRPEYMCRGAQAETAPAPAVFRRDFELSEAATEAAVVVGAGTAATVAVDGVVCGRQERVEYYDSDAPRGPDFFRYDLLEHLELGPGRHRVELHLDAAGSDEPCFVDLVACTPSETTTVVSGPGWTVDVAGTRSPVTVSPLHWRPTESSFVVERPHPLPRASWLRGEPPIGRPSIDISVDSSAVPRESRIRVTIPAQTRRIWIPTAAPVQVTIDGNPVTVAGREIRLEAALTRPATLEARTDERVFSSGASFLEGPITLRTAPAPIELGEWADQGLGDWSGGVTYSTEVDPPADEPWDLDLGDLRGTVEIRLDGDIVHEAFCAPFRFRMPARRGPVQLQVRVYNTLGPYMRATTPTTWVLEGQLSSGLFGPVTMTTRSTR